jgi:hypothetical protein
MTAKEFLLDYMNNHPDNRRENTGEPYFETLYDMLSEYGWLYKEDLHDSRWWTNIFVVDNINGRLIGYNWASTTGDDTPYEKGWEFDEDSICYVEPYEVTEIKYKKIQ